MGMGVKELYDLWGFIEATPKGFCHFCQDPLKTKRQKLFCSKECYELYYANFFWQTASRLAITKAHRKCQRCGVSEKGLWEIAQKEKQIHHFTPLSYLEVHHIIPLNGDNRTWNILNWGGNLIVLCHDCHVLTHREINPPKENKSIDSWELARIKGQKIMALGGKG